MLRGKPALMAGVVVSVLALTGIGCGGPLRYTPRATPRAPEADATIVADIHRDQSLTNLDIKIEHLAPPDRIQAGGTAYVVWARRNDAAQWTRVGQLRYNPSARLGELKATTPEVQFELTVTVETNPTPGGPSSNMVLTQRVGAAQP